MRKSVIVPDDSESGLILENRTGPSKNTTKPKKKENREKSSSSGKNILSDHFLDINSTVPI